ncbi:Casein kinase II subunit alpha' [Sporothrix bragantina]|uniref:Casein kinase II subunit alpha n=1 Tax=Sporothrix bragantina TaxID=671064 RepID=A0ABP0CEQ7_9PEZI
MATHAGIRVPQITSEELFAFHESHFSHFSVADFDATFTGLPEPTSEQNRDVDGVEQEAEISPEDDDAYDPEAGFDLYDELPDIPVPFDEGELADESDIVEEEDGSGITIQAKNEGNENNEKGAQDKQEQPRKKRRRKKNNTGNSNARRLGEKKPDLRKRTWDVVESGLGSLDYDGAETSAGSMQSAPTRRRVQYGDD